MPDVTTINSPLAIVLPTLIGGGAERVVTELANHWVEQGRSVSVITLDDASEQRYPLDARVRHVGLRLMVESKSTTAALWNNARRVKRMRQAIRQSNARLVIGFTEAINITALLATVGLGIGVLVCERTDPRRHRIGQAWSWLRRKTYGRSKGIVVQTEGVRQWAESMHWRRPIFVIPNAAPAALCQSLGEGSPATHQNVVLGLGRLSREKGFDLLLEAFSQAAARYPNWQLVINGEGSERSHLEERLQHWGLRGRASLPGWTTKPDEQLQRAKIFALPSRYEGFPNALVEAMAAGLACVSFDCDSGPREILRDGVDGLLVPAGNVAALSTALQRLMADESLRQQLGSRAREVCSRFSRELILRKWDDVIRACEKP